MATYTDLRGNRQLSDQAMKYRYIILYDSYIIYGDDIYEDYHNENNLCSEDLFWKVNTSSSPQNKINFCQLIEHVKFQAKK